MSAPALRLAVLGAGHWHMERQSASFQAAGAEIVAVHDDDQQVAERWATRLGCPAYAGTAELLDRTPVDLVLVMTPHDQVAATLADLAGRGIAFAVEKPGAIDAAALWPVVESVERQGLYGAVAFVNRFSDFWPALAGLNATGRLRQPATARFRIVNGTPQRYVDDGCGWMLDARRSGGGPLRNLGSHAADAVHLLDPGHWEVLGASTSDQVYGLSIEEHATALLRGPGGQIATIEAGYTFPDVEGTDHEWYVAAADGRLSETVEQLVVRTPDGVKTEPAPSMATRYDRFAATVVETVRAGGPSPVPLRDAARALELVDRIYAAARLPADDAGPRLGAR